MSGESAALQELERDRLTRFDVIFANPPYSIKKWGRAKFSSDPYERNKYGVPPQGCADYAFFQQIFKSLNPKMGRAEMLWPHGVLFRNSEQRIRRQVIEAWQVGRVELKNQSKKLFQALEELGFKA
ncbi:MAG: N-6 DNA methylase [Pontiella sp.]